MKHILEALKVPLSEHGYQKKNNSFWKSEDGFYKLINFQKGAYGNYYFINIGLHPLGLPMLSTEELIIPNLPSESECIIRQRIEQVISSPTAERFKKELVAVNDMEVVGELIDVISEIDQWFKEWGSFQKIENMEFDEAVNMLTVVPVLKKKAFYMLKCYCANRSGNSETARNNFNAYLSESIDVFDFHHVDKFLNVLINTLSKKEPREYLMQIFL